MAEKKRELTMSFRPSKEQKITIEKRAELSGLTKNNYIIRSCLYNRIVIVGKEEYLSLIRTVIDYINGAAYLFQDSSVKSGC